MGVPASGGRPRALNLETRPQDKVQQRTVEPIVELAPVVYILDLLVPQIGPSVPEQVIVQLVPECHVVERVCRVRVPQMVFLLLDVPEIGLVLKEIQKETLEAQHVTQYGET